MNKSYKGSRVGHGYAYAPYNPFNPPQWQDKLRELELKFASWLKMGNLSRDSGLEDVNLMMKAYYPGNYTVVEEYNSARGVFGFTLKFEDQKEKTMWMLKWS